jgi:hypothetical protein
MHILSLFCLNVQNLADMELFNKILSAFPQQVRYHCDRSVQRSKVETHL